MSYQITHSSSEQKRRDSVLLRAGCRFLVSGIFLLLSGGWFSLYAQSDLNARSMGLGGGGAYLTGFESNFYNPANLLIPAYKYPTEIELGSAALEINRRPIDRMFIPLQALEDQFLPGRNGEGVTNYENRQKLYNQWFSDNEDIYSRNAAFSGTIIGVSWQHGPFAYSIGIHTRGINKFTLTKGWFSTDEGKVTSKKKLYRNLEQTIATYQEISVGFAQEVALFNGWSPELNRLYVGIAPKFILPGMYMKSTYRSVYSRDPENNLIQTRSLQAVSSGSISASWNGTTNQLSNTALISPTGWGLGLDMGLTYVKSLGNDLALMRGGSRRALKKSLRFSVSITDIGFVHYDSQVAVINRSPDTLMVQTLPNGPLTEFTGSPGQYPAYLHSDGAGNDFVRASAQNSIRLSLPTALHLGAAFQNDWWTLTTDFTYGLNKNTFNDGGWLFQGGCEIRPFYFLPLRAGLQWQPGHHLILGSGLGIDTRHFSLDFGARFSAPGNNRGFYLMGAAITTLRLHL